MAQLAQSASSYVVKQTQTVVPEPSFRRGVASIVDIAARLAVFNVRGPRIEFQSTAAALRSDRRRVAEDFAAVQPRHTTRLHIKDVKGVASR